ncbi:MAG: DUF2007 domain-containing protein [Flavobacteriales bacterium]|jgi:hypothetical protein|nr:DUF2007 domain-containing protein [Flavobacteriales bacterium]MBK9538592.1 DUF2007 domain-containing protein [Flavobacteriales bacterium]
MLLHPSTPRPDDAPDRRDWILLTSMADRVQASLVVGMLEAHDIAAVLMDQQPSAYPMMGDVGVLVERQNLMTARHLMNSGPP